MYGLTPEIMRNIQAVFQGHPEIERATLYGSRAKGTQREGSDIDLTLYGKDTLSLKDLAALQRDLDDLNLPYTFDLSIFAHLDHPSLIEHIERVGQPFYPLPEKDQHASGGIRGMG